MFGDIVKVTPTSKVVGDMALFMVQNNLSAEDVVHGPRDLSFPESVIEFFMGQLGQPAGGFPAELQARVLKGRTPLNRRPGATMPPADFEATRKTLSEHRPRPAQDREVVTHLLYPRVYADFLAHLDKYSDVSVLPTPVFFYGMEPGDEVSIDIEEGKTLILKFQTVGDPHVDGTRIVFFELNGQPREVVVVDQALTKGVETRRKAEANNPLHVAAPMPGLVVGVAVTPGEEVKAGQKLLALEAMKMETTVYAERPAKVAEVLARAGTQVEGGDLLIRFE
jgi:pyruvate carboxylase